MSTPNPSDSTSYKVNIKNYDTNGLCSNFTLRRHKFEAEANAGCHEARSDWARFVGPIEQFGGYNPLNGNFSAVVLPLSKPERLRLIAYVLECKVSGSVMLFQTLPICYAKSC
jgi:ophiobolin F synthase